MLGSGQVVRLTLSLGVLLNEDVHLFNIRKYRNPPYLLLHHKNTIDALAEISQARTEGVFEGSSEIFFYPKGVRSGDYCFRIENDGCVVSFLEAVCLGLSLEESESTIRLQGGSSHHLPHFVQVVCPTLEKIGLSIEVKYHRLSFQPERDSELELRIKREYMEPLKLMERGNLENILIEYYVPKESTLPEILGITNDVVIKRCNRENVLIKAKYEKTILGIDGLIGNGKDEKSYLEVREEFERLISSKATLDIYTAEQVLPFLIFNRGLSKFVVNEISDHLVTEAKLINSIMGRKVIKLSKNKILIQGVEK